MISGLLLLFGIGQRTFLAGPTEIPFEVASTGDAPYAIIAADQLEGMPGQANVVLEGEDLFVATGTDRDIQAWVEPYDHAVLTFNKSEDIFEAEQVAAALPETEEEATDAAEEDEGTEPEGFAPIDPRGSDLWIDERTSSATTDSLRAPVKVTEGQSVIIASDGTEPLPVKTTIAWVQDRATPWAGPTLVAGALFAVIGGILYLLAIDRDRRGLGPQRGRKGPLLGIRNSFTRRAGSKENGKTSMRAVVPAIGIVAVLGLTGCSADYWPQFGADAAVDAEVESTEAPPATAPLPVTEGQIDRIVKDVAAVASEAEDALDAEVLATRFTGDSLQQREANYTIRSEVSDYGVRPPRITDEELDYQLVQSTEGWPRTMLVTVASEQGVNEEEEDSEESASPSLALILTQQSPHENFLVSRVIALHGGIEMPPAAPAEEGTALLAADLQGLVLPPGEVGAAFASVLVEGEGSEYAEYFNIEEVTLFERYGQAQASRAQQEAEDAETPLSHSVTAAQGDEPVIALSTGVEGALVATTVIEEQSVESDGRFKPQASGVITALSGIEGEQDRIVQVISHQLLFFVPSKEDGGQVQLLGETSELIEVRT